MFYSLRNFFSHIVSFFFFLAYSLALKSSLLSGFYLISIANTLIWYLFISRTKYQLFFWILTYAIIELTVIHRNFIFQNFRLFFLRITVYQKFYWVFNTFHVLVLLPSSRFTLQSLIPPALMLVSSTSLCGLNSLSFYPCVHSCSCSSCNALSFTLIHLNSTHLCMKNPG